MPQLPVAADTLGSPLAPYRQPQVPVAADRLRQAAAIARRRWPVFVAIVVAVLGAVAIYTWHKTPLYTATATLLVNDREVNIASKGNEVIPVASDEDRAINAEAQILQSADVADRVAADIGRRSAAWVKLLTDLPAPQGMTWLRDALGARLRVDRPGGTQVLGVSFTAPDPRLAAFVANDFVQRYLEAKSDARLGAARAADAGLRGELERMRGRVEGAEAAVAAYRRSHNLLSTDGVTLTERDQSLYDQQEASARMTLAEEQARLTTARLQLRHGSAGDDVGEALGSPVVNQLRSQRALASAKLAELQSRYRPDHPQVIDARRELADIDSAIGGEISRVIRNLEARVEVARQRDAAAGGIAAHAKGELANNASAAVGLNELERRAEALRTNYAGLLERQTAVASQAVVADNDARLLSSAEVPSRPTTPNKLLNLVLGGLLATFLGATVVALLHLFDQRLVTSSEVESALGLHHLANVPRVDGPAGAGSTAQAPADIVLDEPYSLLAEVMRSLILLIERQRHTGATQIVGLTSAQPGEGKSTLAACLARVAAASGRRTLLIEGDIRRPVLAAMFGVTPTAGLLDVLSERTRLQDALIRDERSGAWLLLARGTDRSTTAVGSAAPLEALMAKLDKVFDLVIIDTAPALAAHESRLLMHFVDLAILVVRWKHTRAPAVRAALKRLRAIGVEPLGTVLARVDMKAVGAFGWDDVDHEYASWSGYFG